MADPADVTVKPGKMTDEDLLALIRSNELASLGSSVAAGATISTTVYPNNQVMTTLEIDRYNALNAYFARPLGNEVENRSQVVLPELRDTIEWIMPQLMRIFMSAKAACRFDPENQRDEEQAKLETEGVNHIFTHENNGFFVLHDYFKDALLMRNGYVDVNWKEAKEVSVSRYTGLNEMELTMLLQPSDKEKLEVLEQREYTVQVPMPGPEGQPQALSPMQVFDIKVRRTAKKGHICVECIPPEEMRVSSRARQGMENLPFAMHLTDKTRSDLIAEGFDKNTVNGLAAGRPNWMEIDALARNQVVDQLSVENPSDFAMQEVEMRKVIMQVDYDGDGVAELRRIIVGGDKILENEVIEETSFASAVPKRMPHRHTGISLYDEIMDLQVIKTTLWRQGLDNLTISNNQRVAVDWRNANFDDLLTSRPGGVVRGNGPPANWIAPIIHPSNLVEQVLPALNYLDEQKASRTGIGPGSLPVDPDELQDVTKGAHAANLAQAALKVEMIARLLAEGVKPIFLKIRSLLIRHQQEPLEFQLGGKWVNIDPRTWRPTRTNVQTNVGLGSGNRDEMRANVMLLGQAQGALTQMGLVGPKQAYETFKVLCEALGFNTPERFAMDPQSPEYAEHQQQMQQMAASQPPPPPVQVAQIRAQTEQAKAKGSAQVEVLKLKGQLATAQEKLAAEQLRDQHQLVHEAIQGHADRTAEGVSAHHDREIALDAAHERLTETLIKAFAQILSQKVKDDAQADRELASDVRGAESQLQ